MVSVGNNNSNDIDVDVDKDVKLQCATIYLIDKGDCEH